MESLARIEYTRYELVVFENIEGLLKRTKGLEDYVDAS